MSKIKIITDSTADLSPEIYQKYQIEVIPLNVNFGLESFKDGIDITLQQLYARYEKERVFPKTSATSPYLIKQVFEKYLKDGYDIFFTGIGSHFSKTFESAQLAKDELKAENISLVDSKNLSSGSGLLVLKAVKLVQEGKSLQEITQIINQLVDKVETHFAVENLSFLYKGGRVSGTKYVFGTLLRAHPILKITDGTLNIFKTPKGKMVKALDEMLHNVESVGVKNIDLDHVMITHAFAEESVEYLKEHLIKLGIPQKSILVTTAGTVIGSHCGPNTIGILFIKK